MNASGPFAGSVTLSDLVDGSYTDLIIYRCVAGSRMYGTSRPGSDVDIRGIFCLPASAYLSLDGAPLQVSDERNDTVYYSFRRFIELAMNANPNIIELLYAPDDCVQWVSPVMQKLIDQRERFISKRCFLSHVGYAQAQIKRARGRNKWVNNPQPEAAPVKDNFCWIIRENGSEMPFRPVPLRESGIGLATCHCAAVEHASDLYRLYHYGPDAKGVFRNGHLVCESIPVDDERERCVGLLLYNRAAYEQAVKDHHNYWHWRKERNADRWRSQEQGEMDYDAKNMMHTFRLLLSGINLLEYGRPLVRFEGELLDFLMGVLAGRFDYATLIEMVEARVREFEGLQATSMIPETVDHSVINALFLGLNREWEESRNA